MTPTFAMRGRRRNAPRRRCHTPAPNATSAIDTRPNCHPVLPSPQSRKRTANVGFAIAASRALPRDDDGDDDVRSNTDQSFRQRIMSQQPTVGVFQILPCSYKQQG